LIERARFVIFQFSDVDKYGDVYRDPFILSKYNTATQPWSLDDCYTGAVYTLGKSPAQNTADSSINLNTVGLSLPKRCGEWGYSGYPVGATGGRTIIGYYESIFGRRLLSGSTAVTNTYPVIYQRSLFDLTHEFEYNPVITNIPICNTMVPVPYYIPNDFGITEVIGTNTIAYGDIIKVGATTQWKVLQYGNNMTATTYNSAIAFVAKTVN